MDLDLLIDEYYANKQQLDKYKKLSDEGNKEIKNKMDEIGENVYQTEKYKAAINISSRETFVEPALIQKLKDLGVTSPIKTVEVIDYDELENVIYNGKLNASELSPYKVVKEVKTLRVTERKEKEL